MNVCRYSRVPASSILVIILMICSLLSIASLVNSARSFNFTLPNITPPKIHTFPSSDVPIIEHKFDVVKHKERCNANHTAPRRSLMLFQLGTC